MSQSPSILRRPTLHLADSLFLTAHSPVSARCLISQHALALGLGGAMLAELVLAKHLHIDPEHRSIVPVEAPGRDAKELDRVGNALRNEVLNPVNRETTDIRLWLAYLATPTSKGDNSYTWVGDRLVTKEILTRRLERRRLVRKVKVYEPVDYAALMAHTRLTRRLHRGALLDYSELLWAGLIFATGLDANAFKDEDESETKRLRDLVNRMPPALSCLVTDVESAVGDAVMKSHY